MTPSHFTKSIVATALAAGTLCTAVALATGVANADAADDTYLASLDRAGIPRIAADRAISAGRAVCLNLSQGATPDLLVASFVEKNVFATAEQDRAMITASMTAYCPQYLPLLHP